MRRILLIIDDLMHAGAQKQVLQILRNIDRSQFEMYVAYIDKKNDQLDEVKKLSKEVKYFPRRWRWDVFIIFKIVKFILEKKISLVHTHLFMSSFFGVIAAKLAGVPVVNQFIHTAAKPEFYRHAIMKLLFSFSDLIVASSVSGRDLFFHNNPSKVIVINNMVSLNYINNSSISDMRKAFGLENYQYVVGMVANFNKWKDYPTYFRMAKLVIKELPHTVFLCVGDGNKREEYMKIVDDLGIRESVKFLGQIPEVLNVVKILDVGVLFSFSKYGEAQSFAIIEYMLMEKPVVASRVGGIIETIDDGVTGFLVDAGNYRAAASVLINLLREKDLAKKMGNNGRKKIEKLFNAKKIIKKIESLYLETLESNSSRKV